MPEKFHKKGKGASQRERDLKIKHISGSRIFAEDEEEVEDDEMIDDGMSHEFDSSQSQAAGGRGDSEKQIAGKATQQLH